MTDYAQKERARGGGGEIRAFSYKVDKAGLSQRLIDVCGEILQVGLWILLVRVAH